MLLSIFDFITHALRRVRIRYRLLTSFLLISLIPAIFVGIYASHIYTDAMNSKLMQSTEQSISLLNENFITELNKFRDYLNTISVTDGVEAALTAQQNGEFVLDATSVTQIADALRTIPFQSSYLKNIRVVDRNHNILYDLGYDDISMERFSQVLDTIDSTAGYDSLQYIRTYRNYDKIVLGRKIFRFARPDQPLGYILAYIDEKFVSDTLLSNVSFSTGSNIMLLSESGQVISSQNKEILGTSYFSETAFQAVQDATQKQTGTIVTFPAGSLDTDDVSMCLYNRELSSYIAVTIPSGYFTEETQKINHTLVVICAVLVVTSLLFTTLVYSSIMQPINRMVSLSHVFSDADLEKYIGDSSSDELGVLANTIDKMKSEMKELSIQNVQDQQQKRKLELEMLQYQINPHFLFNTLNSLRFVAQLNEVPVLEDGIASLSSLLRHSLVKRREMIPISAEIENLKNYFTLQNIRYAGMFQVEYNLDADTLDYAIPRFTLQPLAENAIIHGTNGASCITITIVSRFCGEDLELLIQDNGCGFDISAAEDKSKERFSGIGLSNVDQRLHLHFGPQYGLQITSQPGEGTCCRIRIPKRKEEENDVSSSFGR